MLATLIRQQCTKIALSVCVFCGLFLAFFQNADAQWIDGIGKDGNPPTSLQLLTGDTLRSAFAGRTMDGTYKQFRERSGTSHFTETFTKDGKTIYREGKINDTGEWKLANDQVICFRYNGPLAGGVSCYTVFKQGTCLYSFHPSRVVGGRPIDNNQWSAKTVIRGELSTCDDLVG